MVIHELKKVRQATGLTLAAVSKRTGLDQATLSRPQNGRPPNPTVDTLWRECELAAVRRSVTNARPFGAPTWVETMAVALGLGPSRRVGRGRMQGQKMNSHPFFRRFLPIALVMGVCQGCQSKPNKVEFVVPNGFHGTFIVKSDDPGGIVLEKVEGRYVVQIPKNGVLGIKGYDRMA